ncbi:MAG: histidine phosphatase family protein [Aeromicrobium sp.]|uniref:histidine phosphatase family protein n=1 Tax=Aeromicrobium sp. TaxID=1871063 RepID=UPI0039E67FF2
MGAISLIRHGQASWASDDYDQLSDLGQRQASWVGLAWEAGGLRPTWSVAGSMRRHAQTAVGAIDAIDGDLYDVNAGWNEYDHLALVQMSDAADRPADAKEFQALLDAALERWVAGEASADGESFAQFSERVLGSLDAAVRGAGSGQHVAVFTSGGPIALVASHLLAGDASLFITLNRVVVNASVTTLMVGRGGTRLLTFNEHSHIPRDSVTFR